MALKYYKHKETGEVKRSLKGSPGPEYEEIISAPNQKFMVTANAATKKSKLKDQERILKERARNHSRDHELDDTIQINKENQFQVSQNLLNSKGQKRRKIDDI